MNAILVPTDFSIQAENALKTAVNIARKTGAEIYLVHVLEMENTAGFVASGTFIPDDGMDNLFLMKLIEQAKHKLLPSVNNPEYAGARIKHEVRVGNLFQQISEILNEKDIDLIVMGTKGISSLFRAVTGTNTDKVIRIAKCMVLSVKDASDNLQIRNILLPTDFEDTSYKFVYKIKQLQKIFDFTIHIVYVNTIDETKSDEEVNLLVKQFVKDHELGEYKTHIVKDIYPGNGILKIAEELNADMIAMLTHGRSGLAQLMQRSITEDVIHETKRPILSYNIR